MSALIVVVEELEGYRINSIAVIGMNEVPRPELHLRLGWQTSRLNLEHETLGRE